MNGNGIFDGSEKSDDVRRKPDDVRSSEVSRTQRYSGRYTDRWKDICREIVNTYARVSSESLHEAPLGATRLLRRIIKEDGADPSSVTLSVDNLYDWLSFKTQSIDDVKFSYVDNFVRALQLDEAGYRPILQKISQARDDDLRASLMQMFGHRKRDVVTDAFVHDSLNNRAFVSPPFQHKYQVLSRPWHPGPSAGQPIAQIAMYFHSYKDGTLAVNAIYSSQHFMNLRKLSAINQKEVIVYFGYAVPRFSGECGYQKWSLHLVRRGLEGIEQLNPFTISEVSCSTQEESAELNTDWIPQLLMPLRMSWVNQQIGRSPPSLNIHRLDSLQPDENMLKDGRMSMTQIPESYGFITAFLHSLTNEYVIW